MAYLVLGAGMLAGSIAGLAQSGGTPGGDQQTASAAGLLAARNNNKDNNNKRGHGRHNTGNDNGGNDTNVNADNNNSDSGNDNRRTRKEKNSGGGGGGGGGGGAPSPPPPPPVVAQGPCTFQLGFAFLHSILNGVDGNCLANEQPNPANGDSLQGTQNGLMVYQKSTNTMRWTNGYLTDTYSQCGLQQRLNTQTFAWEANPALLASAGPGSPACNLVG